MQAVNWSMSSWHSLPQSSARLLTSSSQPPEQELVTENILAGSRGQEEAGLWLLRRSGSLAPWQPRAARHRRRVANVAMSIVQCAPHRQSTGLLYFYSSSIINSPSIDNEYYNLNKLVSDIHGTCDMCHHTLQTLVGSDVSI